MIEWEDEGIILSLSPHGEHAAIVQLFTRRHGRHAGVAPGAQSRRLKGGLQPGAFVSVCWRARLEEHLGTVRLETLSGLPSPVLLDRRRLGAANALLALISVFLAERDPHETLFDATAALIVDLLRAQSAELGWASSVARWERDFLGEIGFGLDLGCCALTGAVDDLIWVSPKTGRAVCGTAGAPWAEKLLRLPAFLLTENDLAPDITSVLAAFRLTGHFLERIEPMGRQTRNGGNTGVSNTTQPTLPAARGLFLERLSRSAALREPS